MSDNFQKPNRNPTDDRRQIREFPMIGDVPDSLQEPHHNNYEGSGFEVSADEEAALRLARKEKLNPPINPQTKTRLEYLSDIGKMTKDVMIGGVTFTLRTLKSKEQRQVYLTLVGASNKVDEAYSLKFHTLAHSLIKIDHQEVAVMVKINSYSDKIKMIEDLEDIVTDQLFSAYQALKEESDKQFSIKTEADMKEVSEGLKK